MDYDRWLWGKKEPFCSLSRHMMAVGACVMEYLGAPSTRGVLSRLAEWMGLNEEEVIHTFAYVASLHDIGKAHPTLQSIQSMEQECYSIPHYRHEQWGAKILKALWQERGWDNTTCAFYATVVKLHHQGKGSSSTRGSVSDQWRMIHADLERRMRALFAPATVVPRCGNADALGVLLSGILILCDWVASSEGFGAEAFREMEDEELLVALREQAQTVLTRYGLITGEACAYPRMDSFSALFPDIPPEGMRPLQKTCETVGGRQAMLTIVEAPMGEGKTEAALYLASKLCESYGKRGVYMALPTSATSNQMVGRVRRMLESQNAGSARLLHSMAWLIDDRSLSSKQFDTEDAGSAEDWLRPLRRGMLTENAVGTVDQAMAAALRIKYGFLRLVGLANKALIIDEIHAYDLFMSTIISRLLEWCRALCIPVVLLSATMQDQQKWKYLSCYGVNQQKSCCAYPLITQVTETGVLVETPVSGTYMRGEILFRPKPCGSNVGAVVDLALLRASGGGCICVMMNTVRQAQAVYRALKARGETQIMLFHARYTARRREEIEKACLDLFGKGGHRPKRMILVCTQVVEQSLDVDFDTMITQLAPMDLLLQRAGRVHRHAGNCRPVGMEDAIIDVIVPETGASEDADRRYAQLGGIYPACVMRCTERMLESERRVVIPDDVRACVEEAYRDISDQEMAAAIKQQLKDQMSVSAAEGELLSPPMEDAFFAELTSNAASLVLMDSDEDAFLRGARTREGDASRRFAFLPKDFPEQGENRQWLRQVMEYSCSCPIRPEKMNLTNEKRDDPIRRKEKQKGKNNNIRGCVLLWEEEDGLYHWRDVAFSCSDEYGIEEVSV